MFKESVNICLWVFMCAMRCTIWEVWMNSNNLLLLWLCQTNCSPERDFKLVWFWERFADSLTQITKHQHSEKSMDICCLFTTGSQFLMSSSIFNYNSQLRCYTINHIINCSFHVKKNSILCTWDYNLFQYMTHAAASSFIIYVYMYTVYHKMHHKR